MARTAGKKQSKTGSSAQSTPSRSVLQTPAASKSAIPEPFVPAPASLRPLFSTLPTDHVYAVHIDKNPASLKKRVYAIPVLMNIIITVLLVVRVYYAAPVYLDQIITIFGYDTAWKVQPETMGVGDLLNTVSTRTGLLMFDYALFAFVGSWPWEFVFGSKYSRHTGAWVWRSRVGFKDMEIIIRKGRKWDTPICSANDTDRDKGNTDTKVWSREEELTIQVKVEPALRKSYTDKTGYLLLDKDWDLDFKAMIDAHRLVDSGKIDLRDLDHIVLVQYQKQWILWRVHEDTETDTANLEKDDTLRVFKDKLSELECEDVFYRWIEMVQYETSLPGGFTTAKKAEAKGELQRMLTERKVDYNKFWDEIGGPDGVPGLA